MFARPGIEPRTLTYELDALPTALRGPAIRLGLPCFTVQSKKHFFSIERVKKKHSR